MDTLQEHALTEVALDKLRRYGAGVVLAPAEAAALLALIEAWHWERT